MWPDNETERDFLNFTGVADTVAEIIVQASGRPISIGISGAWGVGKSSMIRLIRRAIESRDRNESPAYVFVEFNAWLYQGYDDARAALMEVIASKLHAEAETRKKGTEKARELLSRVDWLRAVKLTAGSAISLAMGLPPVGLLGEALQVVKNVAGGTADAKTPGEAATLLGKIQTASSGLLKAKPDSSPPKEIHALRQNFEDTLSSMDVKLVVLIDDLDRCLPETTISTLEAIRLFLFLKDTAFVIAADDAMIKHAVKRHFDGVDDQVVVSYFDKLIQVPIRVPPLGTQEVRAYMMLLFVETSSLSAAEKETIRSKVCQRLTETWKGGRVDRAFLETMRPDLPADLLARLDTAERLAPLMTTASQISGNPRLIKRFLNAVSIRLAISRAHGVGVDEAVLAKMLLFERCGDPGAYAMLTKAVNEDLDGKPGFLAEWEDRANKGEEVKLTGPWDNSFSHEWLTVPPKLAGIDLRGALYVSREHTPLITPEDSLTSEGAALISALLEHPDMAHGLKERLGRLAHKEMTIIMDKLLERARREQVWGTPSILDACIAAADADPAQGMRIAGFLTERPPAQIKPSIVPRIVDYPWAQEVFSAWQKAGVSTQVKKAITQQQKKNGNLN
jgi:predicted KAP-like P-loop ATPase